MRAMVLTRLCQVLENPCPLELVERPPSVPGDGELRIRVTVCGVCHTELDEIEGRTPPSSLPRVLGHQAVGRVDAVGPGADPAWIGERVGVAWIYHACGVCRFCKAGDENLCERFRGTGRDADGGYADDMTVPAPFVHRIPAPFTDLEAAPLLCAGAIGYRSLKLANLADGQTLGLTGFGASAHLVLMMARHRYPRSRVFVFARSEEERAFARELGAVWAGDVGERSPEPLARIIDTTPVWAPAIDALANLDRGGRLVINAIRKEETDRHALQRLDYTSHLWLEKQVTSVANVTRADVREFLELAAAVPIRPEVQPFALEDANDALVELKQRKIRGAKVLQL